MWSDTFVTLFALLPFFLSVIFILCSYTMKCYLLLTFMHDLGLLQKCQQVLVKMMRLQILVLLWIENQKLTREILGSDNKAVSDLLLYFLQFKISKD